MKLLLRASAVAIMMSVMLVSVKVGATDVTTPPSSLPTSPILLTSYSVDGSFLQYVELYNASSDLVKLSDWKLGVSWNSVSPLSADSVPTPSIAISLASGDAYLKPKGYAVLSITGSVTGASLDISDPIGGQTGEFISQLSLSNDAYQPYQKSFAAPQVGAWFLGTTTTGYTSTGAYYQFPSDKIRSSNTLYDSGLYQLGVSAPNTFPLAAVEILSNPRLCSPLDSDEACKEYIEFYNFTDTPVSFENTALHIGTLTSFNSILLSGIIQPGQFAIFDRSADGSPLGITNSGGYVWLSDAYGLVAYPNTVVNYGNADSLTHRGQSWALIDDLWQWAVPSPGGPNVALPLEGGNVDAVSKACETNQYRNPLTNRCKLIEDAQTQAPCGANQYRNPATGRCKLLSASSSSVTPCETGQYRNPATNRCKSIASEASSLKPCAPGQERNPTTNRCRNTVNPAIADFPVQVTRKGTQASDSVGWWAFAGVGLVALGYVFWEYRVEMTAISDRLTHLFSRTK